MVWASDAAAPAAPRGPLGRSVETLILEGSSPTFTAGALILNFEDMLNIFPTMWRMGSVLPVPLSRSRCPVVAFPLSRCPGPVVPLAVPVGSQRAAAWRTFAFRRHFGKNEVRSPKTVVKLRFARVRRNPFARNEV